MTNTTLTLLLTLALLGIGGCGQMGPLYMPTEEPAQESAEQTGAEAP